MGKMKLEQQNLVAMLTSSTFLLPLIHHYVEGVKVKAAKAPITSIIFYGYGFNYSDFKTLFCSSN